MATAPTRFGIALGYPVGGASSTATLNAAASWAAVAFVADSARTLSAVRARISALTGTLAGTDITADLYDSTGTGSSPGTAIESGKLPSGTITAVGWYDFTGFTTALTANQMYWVVFKNVNGTPASNFPTLHFISGPALTTNIGGAVRQTWASGTSANSGSTWSVSQARGGFRVAYSDGSFDGLPISDLVAGVTADGIYSTHENGVKFTSPANVGLNVVGAAMYVGAKNGTPTGLPRIGLWTGSSPSNQGYTNSLLSTSIAGIQMIYSYFATPIVINPSTVVRLTLAETTQSDTSGNRWNNTEVFWDTDTNSLAMLPWSGSCVKTTFDGSTWTDTSGSIYGHALLLADATPFASAGGGASGGVQFVGG